MAVTLRIFVLAAGMAIAAGGFLIGARSYDLERHAPHHGADLIPV